MDRMRVEIFSATGWKEIPFEDLRKGCIFRMFHPVTGQRFIGSSKHGLWICTSDAYLNNEAAFVVDVQDLTKDIIQDIMDEIKESKPLH